MLVISTGVLLGEGCVGPNDLRQNFPTSLNSMVYRAIEIGLAQVFSVPLETA